MIKISVNKQTTIRVNMFNNDLHNEQLDRGNS